MEQDQKPEPTTSEEKPTENEEQEQEPAVKSEPPTADQVEESDEEPPDDFLDELLNSAGDIAAACATPLTRPKDVKAEPPVSASVNDAEEIDPSFFDDILQRAENKRRQPPGATRNHLRLKRERFDLEDGEVDDEDEDDYDDGGDGGGGNNEDELTFGNKSKNKKSKKAKRKKSKDEKSSPRKSVNENVEKNSSPPKAENNRPRLQVRAEFRSFCAPADRSPEEYPEEDQPQGTIETHIGSAYGVPLVPYHLSVAQEDPLEQKPEKQLTPEEKLARALERVKLAKFSFLKAKHQKEKQFYPNDPVFSYTPTVRKLPISHSYFTQQIYDNRSPLHTVNNVTFAFNSMATRLNLEEWGLEPLPPKSQIIARVLAYDVDTLFARKQLIKIPDKIQKQSENAPKVEDRELCEPSNSTLYMNVMVQTEPVKVIPLRRKDFYRDKGIQTAPATNVMGTQTSSGHGGGGDLPLFKVIRELNENQLEALDDFIEFILEPTGNSGLDLYQQRKRLAEIYKISQIPAEDSLPSYRKRSASDAGMSERDGPSPPPPPAFERHHDFVRRDSRSHYDQNMERRRPPNPPQSRHVHSQPIRGRYNGNGEAPSSSSSVKYYGRGGMRR